MIGAIGGFGSVVGSQDMAQGTNPLFQTLSSTLGLSASQIQQQVANGSSLAQIASNQGVSQGTLVSAVENALSKAGPGQSMSSSRISDLANKIVNQQGVPSGPPAGASATGVQGQSSAANPLFQALSSTLGLSASQIQQQLASGSSLAQIASNQGVSQNTLVSTVAGILSQGPAQGLSSSQVADMANTIVSQQGLPSGSPSGMSGAPASGGGSSSASSTSTEFILLMLESTAQGSVSSASPDAAYTSGSASSATGNEFLA